MSPTVFIRAGTQRRRKFHKDRGCKQLRKPPARGVARELLEVELSSLEFATPCKNCYPDAPRAKSWHRNCEICKSWMPCEHNGGVPVYINYTHTKRTLFNEPGDVSPRLKYVWPENVRNYVSLAS